LRLRRLLLASAAVSSLLALSPGVRGQELPAPAAIRSALERVFARPEFQPPRKGRLAEFWEWLRDWIGRALSWLRARFEEGFSLSGAVDLVLWALSIVLVFLVVHLALKILSQKRPPRTKAERSAPSPVVALSPSPHLARASQLSREGSFLEAAHALYLAVLLWLDGAGRSRYEDSKTGGDYARELSGSALAGPFARLLSAFYPVAFGARAAFKEAYRAMRSAASEMGVPE
jgi:hypothetical protein